VNGKIMIVDTVTDDVSYLHIMCFILSLATCLKHTCRLCGKVVESSTLFSYPITQFVAYLIKLSIPQRLKLSIL